MVTETRWTRDGTCYFSDCDRYCIQDFKHACDVGPWIVTYDPEGKRAGIAGRMIVKHADTLRQAKADVAAHLEHGDDFWHHIPYGHIRTDGPQREQLKAYRQGEVDYWAKQLRAEGIDLGALADDEWVRDDAVRIIRATFATEKAARRIVTELTEANR